MRLLLPLVVSLIVAACVTPGRPLTLAECESDCKYGVCGGIDAYGDCLCKDENAPCPPGSDDAGAE